MMNAINPKKQIAPMRHVATVPIMIRLRATLLSKNLLTMTDGGESVFGRRVDLCSSADLQPRLS
jgi:hypothetical protein